MNQPNELYGSHLPLLSRLLDLTHGPVLELGMGLFSTPLLHTVCFLQERMLLSADNDPEWYEENKKWEGKFHEVIQVHSWEGFKQAYLFTNSSQWSIAFVDHKPAKRRKEEIKFLAKTANFVVIHDSEPESDKFFKYSWIYKLFKYRYDYTSLRPHTTVLSNFVNVEKLLS